MEAGQPNKMWSRAQSSGGCSHKSFLVPNLIQLILREFCSPKEVPEPQRHPANHGVSRDSGIPFLSPQSESDHHNLWLLPSQHPLCLRGGTPTLQSFTLGEQDLGHLYSHQNTDRDVGHIMPGFLTWDRAAGPPLFIH